jgi:hypothetical protein
LRHDNLVDLARPDLALLTFLAFEDRRHPFPHHAGRGSR